MRRADRFVSTSGAVRESYLGTNVPAAKISWIPNGVDTQRFVPATEPEKTALRQRLNLPAGTMFVYTGRLHQLKGLPMLLRSWRRVVTDHPSAHLVLVGGDSAHLGCEQDLRNYLREHRLSGTVAFVGVVEDVCPYLQTADWFVLPSDSEAFPMSLAEAKACGLPAISTRTGGGLELVRPGETGLLVDIGDEAGLAMAIATALRLGVMARDMGRRARELIIEHYSIESCIERHLHLLADLSRDRDGPRTA